LAHHEFQSIGYSYFSRKPVIYVKSVVRVEIFSGKVLSLAASFNVKLREPISSIIDKIRFQITGGGRFEGDQEFEERRD
jgi:hypothetical protein